MASVGLTEKDLFNNVVSEKPHIVAEYIYKDEEGNPLYKVIRFEPKSFAQAKYDNGNWVFKMAGVRYVLYNLPNVIKSDVVYFVEGEKDADNLNKIGLVATTTVSGASSYAKRAEEYSKYLKDKTIYVVPDNDKAGYQYAESIKKSLIGLSKEVKILKIVDEIKDFKEKGDISDVIAKYGKEKTLEILENLKVEKVEKKEKKKKEECVYAEDYEINEENILSVDTMEKLYQVETQDMEKFIDIYGNVKKFCKNFRITGFDKVYKMYKEAKREVYISTGNTLMFPELTDKVFKTNKYEINSEGYIYEVIPNIGKVLVSYQAIVPIEKYINLETGLEKIKIAFWGKDQWNTIIVDKSVISSTQSIVKLSDFGVAVTSENSKLLIKYLSEIENLNRDIIPVKTSISRLGWCDEGVLAPYNQEYEFDNEKDIPNLHEKFGESGSLEDWVEFFKERRKHNVVSRIVLASAVGSILLKRIKQSGFTIHVWGESEYGKTVACMVGQSIFGNPSQNDNKGIGINFNLTNAGLEYKLNLYNNIPLFINEMQHQKDAKDYDKLLFMISEGKGKSRSTKNGGIARENSWNNIVITNGEKNIIKDNSNAGAYNRCLSCEITEYTYENLSEVADFVKENYGKPIREILKHLDEYDCNAIYKNKLKMLEGQDITNKQKILEAIIMLGDKILTDIIFKDEFYLQQEDFENKTVRRKDVATEERAYEVIKDWVVSEQRHFLDDTNQEVESQEIKVEIFGRKMRGGFVAIIPSVLKKVLSDNGYDFTEVLNAWKRKGYLKHEKGRNTLTVQINGSNVKCVALDMYKDAETTNWEELQNVELPF